MTPDKAALMALADRASWASEPSYSLFRAVFDIVFPEPTPPKRFSMGWWFPGEERCRWLNAEYHFEILASRGRWNDLALWLSGYRQTHSLKVLEDFLRARAGADQ